MKILVHKQISASVKLFLQELGFKSVWNKVDEDSDELVVLPDRRVKLLAAIKEELDKTGFIPFQYSMKFNKHGKAVKGVKNDKGTEKVEFIGEIKEVKTFKNISGDFHLLRYQDTEGNNYLNKRYNLDKEIVHGKVSVSCRPVCILYGLNGEFINLINHARVKPVDEIDLGDL